VDNDGCLWVALYLGAQFVDTRRRALVGDGCDLRAAGDELLFWRKDGQDLFITKRRVLLPEWRLLGAGFTRELAACRRAPGAAAVFACRPGIGGTAYVGASATAPSSEFPS